MIFAVCGCSITKEDTTKKVKDIDYTVVEKDAIPEVIAKKIDEIKNEKFKVNYTEGNYLYIAIGYGEKPTGGYSIQVKDFYRAKDCIVVETKLIGPSQEDSVVTVMSYPYIVIKIENMDLPVCYK
jgi:hypothetical protein